MSKSVLYFGIYEPKYSRNRIIIKGLKKNGVTVYENCSLKTFLKAKNIIVGFPGFFDIYLAFILGKLFGKKVFFDIFTSRYETYVIDRKYYHKNSFKAKIYYFIDWLGVRCCDVLIADTKSHAKFYSDLYKIALKKILVVYLGVDDEIFYPQELKTEYDVLFYGSYQPLQGVEYIVKAAKELPTVKFLLIGEGQTRSNIENLAKGLENIKFKGWIPIEDLATEMNKAKILLGIFGDSQKGEVVASNKVYDALACKKITLTKKTNGVEELFINGKEILLVYNPNNLAKEIVKVLNNPQKYKKIAEKGYQKIRSTFTPEKVVSSLISEIE